MSKIVIVITSTIQDDGSLIQKIDTGNDTTVKDLIMSVQACMDQFVGMGVEKIKREIGDVEISDQELRDRFEKMTLLDIHK